MKILLYNPLSKSGKDQKFVDNMIKKLSKEGEELTAHNLLDILDVSQFIEELKLEDKIYVLGGDGTINRIINAMKDKPIKQEIYMLRAGTGNDFFRSINAKEEAVNISKYLIGLPRAETNNKQLVFLNGVGVGLDGLISDLVNNSRFKKNKFNYFRHAIEGFLKFRPVSGKIKIDDLELEEKKLWLISVMNSQYFGGGMKIAPYADRNKKELDVVLVKNVSKWLLILIFPTIYLGWHKLFKRYVKFYKGKNVEISLSDGCYIQADGEAYYPVDKLKASVV